MKAKQTLLITKTWKIEAMLTLLFQKKEDWRETNSAYSGSYKDRSKADSAYSRTWKDWSIANIIYSSLCKGKGKTKYSLSKIV
jgi:hypothetical protein